MYTCHLCSLTTKQLNSLMSCHYKKHINEIYNKEQYKRDLLIANGRPPIVCSICKKETTIPKGESEYPKFHKQCDLKNRVGANNSNWRGGISTEQCAECSKPIIRHASSFKGRDNKFCSISCTMIWYGRPENRTEAQKRYDIEKSTIMKKHHKDPIYKERMAKARQKMLIEGRSKKEIECYNIVKSMYPSTRPTETVKYYSFDIFIPDLNLLIEFDGTYWHSLAIVKARDKRKETYIKKYRPHLKLLRIKEEDWDLAKDRISFIKSMLTPFLI